jgi:hypothetical protein
VTLLLLLFEWEEKEYLRKEAREGPRIEKDKEEKHEN